MRGFRFLFVSRGHERKVGPAVAGRPGLFVFRDLFLTQLSTLGQVANPWRSFRVSVFFFRMLVSYESFHSVAFIRVPRFSGTNGFQPHSVITWAGPNHHLRLTVSHDTGNHTGPGLASLAVGSHIETLFEK